MARKINLPQHITIPDGGDIKQWFGRNWKVLLPWVLTILFAYLLYRQIFHNKPLPQKVEKTAEYQDSQRVIDSMGMVLERARDSVSQQGVIIERTATLLTMQKSNYRLTQQKLNEILNAPALSLPDYTDREITDILERKYGDSAKDSFGTPYRR